MPNKHFTRLLALVNEISVGVGLRDALERYEAIFMKGTNRIQCCINSMK